MVGDESVVSYVAGRPAGLVDALWRHGWLIAAVTILAGLLGAVYAQLQPTSYVADATITLTDPRGTFEQRILQLSPDPIRHGRNEAERARSPEVAARAAELVGGSPGAAAIRASTSVTPSEDRDLLTIRATRPTPEQSRDVANAVAEAYRDASQERVARLGEAAAAELEAARTALEQEREAAAAAAAADPADPLLQANLQALTAQLTSADTEVRQLAIDVALYGSGVQSIQEASLPQAASGTSPLVFGGAAALVGLIAACAFAWWRSELVPVASDQHDPALVLEAPLLGAVPKYRWSSPGPPLPTSAEPSSPAAEAYQSIASALVMALDRLDAAMVLITSPRDGDGKTSTAINVAVAAMSGGRKVLLVDGDHRKRGVSGHLGEHGEGPGLVDLGLRSDLTASDCVHRWDIDDDVSLEVLTSGTAGAHSAGFFRSPAFQSAMAALHDHGSMTLVDGPPVLEVAATGDIAAATDAVVVVVNDGTPLRTLADTRSRLEQAGTVVVGYVFNAARHIHADYGERVRRWRRRS